MHSDRAAGNLETTDQAGQESGQRSQSLLRRPPNRIPLGRLRRCWGISEVLLQRPLVKWGYGGVCQTSVLMDTWELHTHDVLKTDQDSARRWLPRLVPVRSCPEDELKPAG